MILPDSQPPAHLIPLLASVMLVIQLLIVVQRMLVANIRLFGIQSFFLVCIAFIVGFYSKSGHIYVVGGLMLLFKVLFLPWFLERIVRRTGMGQEMKPFLNAPTAMLLCGALTLLGYIVAKPFSSTQNIGTKTLAVAITLMLTGFFLMINRRTALTQVLALLTAENGVFLAAIALTSYGMPLVVELGVFFDVMVAVMVLGILVYRIRVSFASVDVGELNRLKG